MAIKALTFDTGGTILDWHRGISGAFAKAGAARGASAGGPAPAAIALDGRRAALVSALHNREWSGKPGACDVAWQQR